MDDFEYFGYSSQVGLNKEIDGILGLSQNKPMMLASEDVAVGPLLVEELKASGEISSPKFSFALENF